LVPPAHSLLDKGFELKMRRNDYAYFTASDWFPTIDFQACRDFCGKVIA